MLARCISGGRKGRGERASSCPAAARGRAECQAYLQPSSICRCSAPSRPQHCRGSHQRRGARRPRGYELVPSRRPSGRRWGALPRRRESEILDGNQHLAPARTRVGERGRNFIVWQRLPAGHMCVSPLSGCRQQHSDTTVACRYDGSAPCPFMCTCQHTTHSQQSHAVHRGDTLSLYTDL